MFQQIYQFLFNLLFNDITLISAPVVEFACVLLTCFVIGFCIYVATLPFRWLFNLIGGNK